MIDASSDLDCLRRIPQGDTAALGELYDRWTPFFYPHVRRLLGSGADAVDALQDAWLDAWKRAGEYDSRYGEPGAWMLQLVRSRARLRWRDRAAVRRAMLAGAPSPAPGAHEPLYLDLCAGHVLGALEPAELSQLGQHMAGGCPACETALADLSDAAVLEGRADDGERPGTILRDRLLIAVASTRHDGATQHTQVGADTPPAPRPAAAYAPPREPARRQSPGVFAALGWGLAIGLGVMCALLNQQVRDLRAELARARVHANATQNHEGEVRQWASVIEAPAARVGVLAATRPGGAAPHGRAVVDPSTRRAVVVLEHVRAPEGRDYELWAVRRDGRQAIGVIAPNAAGRAILHLDDVGDTGVLQGFLVSLEPRGGAPTESAPSGPVVASGRLGD